MPDSERFTLSTSAACASMGMFRWMKPIPPSWASAMARGASVTVSMAAETMGTLRAIRRVRRVVTSTSEGSTSDFCGTRRTSSKVRASGIRSSSIAPPKRSLSVCAVALLVLAPAPARTWLVAPHLLAFATIGLDLVVATLGFPRLGPRECGRRLRRIVEHEIAGQRPPGSPEGQLRLANRARRLGAPASRRHWLGERGRLLLRRDRDRLIQEDPA